MIIINTKVLKNSSFPKLEIDTLKTQDLAHLIKAVTTQNPLRVDASGHFYRLYTAQGALSPIIRLVNLVIKLVKERSFSAFRSQDQAISQKALSMLDKAQNYYTRLLENIPVWKLTKSDQKKLDTIREKKKTLSHQYEKNLKAIQTNLDKQLKDKLEKIDQISSSKIAEYRQKIKAGKATIEKLIALKKTKERESSKTPLDNLYDVVLGPNKKRIEDYSVDELKLLIQKSIKKLQDYQLPLKTRLDELKNKKQDLQLQADQIHQKRAKALEDKYYLLTGNLSQKERSVVKESRELFKKEQNIDGIQKSLSSFQIALSSISRLSLAQKTQSTFHTRIAAIQEQVRYLHTMAEKAIDTNIVLSKTPSKRSMEGSSTKKLDQIKERLKTIKEELNIRISLPKESEERALSFTSELKDHIDTLNLIQKENPKLKTAITKVRQFIAAQIASMPRIRLEFHEIYSTI